MNNWKTNTAGGLSFGLALLGWHINELNADEIKTLVTGGVVLLLSAYRMQVNTPHVYMPRPVVSISFGVLAGLAMSYKIGMMSYADASFAAVASFGVVGLEHKVRKLKRYRGDRDAGGYDTDDDNYY